jgi:hypothetical protein
LLEHERVGPGELVLSKFLPVRASWVTPSTTRRGVDANCVRIVGLGREEGFWIANVIEHPHYQEVLGRRAASSTIRRLGLRDLKELRVPNMPDQVPALAQEWLDATNAEAGSADEIRDISQEIAEDVLADLPEPTDERVPQFYSPHDIHESWVPVQVALGRFQNRALRSGWMRLGELIAEHSGRMRGRRVAAIRVLRLGDTAPPIGFDLPELAELTQPTFRIYADPLRPGEVLLSVLGSSPKVVFNHPPQDTSVWVADHWVRLSPRSTPGVLGLVLQSAPVAWQLGLAASGAARQFISRADLRKVVVPTLPAERARRLETRLRSRLEMLDAAKARLRDIQSKMAELVDHSIRSAA